MRKFTLHIALLLISVGSFAQKGKVLDARNSVAKNDLKNAKILIDEAATDPKFQNDPQLYYWKAYIYKELYKEQDRSNQQSPYREASYEAYKKLMNFKGKMSEDSISSAINSVRYLSSTYWNSAAVTADSVNYDIAIDNFEKFKESSYMVDPSTDLTEKEIKFYMKIATVYVDLYEVRANSPAGDIFFEKAKDEYSKIIELDNKNLMANYNLGIHYYNKAVNIIKNLDVGTSLEELARQEDICVELFLQSLPYVKTAYELDPERKETLIGLTGIYWSLNDLEKYKYYQEKLSSLE